MKRTQTFPAKTDCFGYDNEKGECRALNTVLCTCQKKCSFYKHKSEVNFEEIERNIKEYTSIQTLKQK